jgi:phosphate transport system substrate-binding protein
MTSTKKAGIPPIVFIIGGILLLGGGYYGYTNFLNKPTTATTAQPATTQQAVGSGLTLSGSTSMVQLNKAFSLGYLQATGNTVFISTDSKGSDGGIAKVLTGELDLAASSRALTPVEAQKLTAVVVAKDYISVVIGINNPFKGSLTKAQVAGIYTGSITNWKQVGGPSAPIHVIVRAQGSGTAKFFKSTVLEGRSFATGSHVTLLPSDETTGMLRQLKTDGIGFATNSQVDNQATVRAVPVTDASLERSLFYVYATNSPKAGAVKSFLDYVVSPAGRQAIGQ